jgi:glucose dehydrogenase
VTAGGVVFYGTMEGWFKTVNAETGKELWKFKTGSGIIGQPTVYRGPDGSEYVAILSGVGSGPARSSPAVSTRVTAAQPWASSMR